MKNTFTFILSIFLFSFYQINAQYNIDSPWMQDLKNKQNKDSKKDFTLTEISNAFNNYWDLHEADKNKKGSGFKPFKRWEDTWSLSLDKNGMLTTPDKIWSAWEEKNKLQQAKSTTDLSDWQSVGPFTQESKSGQGRINTIIVDPNNPNTYYVGAPAGGIWKSTDSGTTWSPLSDYLPQIGVSGIAIDPQNSDIIYISTGDDDAGHSYSIGVLKSTDGGNTWNNTGLQFTNTNRRSNEIYIHPTNSNILWVATSVGLYKTINAGNTWLNKHTGNIRDLKIHPTNPNIVYIVKGSTFYKSTNGGDTFSSVSSGLPISSSRLAIEVTPANPNLVFILSADTQNSFQGLYKSTNSGLNFNRTNEFDNIFQSSQSWYDMALTVSDTNENIIFVGVLDIWKSTNGGDDFFRLNHWFDPSEPSYTHADIHFLRYFNGDLFCGSDGGIYKSTNDGTNFNELNESLVISQYYRIAVSKQTANNIVGGLQDNGGFAYSNNTWYRYHGGDGMDCVVDLNNPNTYYGFTQYGRTLNVTHNGGVTGQGVVGAPEDQGGIWITPLVINSQNEIYAGYQHFYKLNNNSWQKISITGSNFDQDNQITSLIEIDPNNDDVIYAIKRKRLYKSTTRGLTFSLIYEAQSRVTSIEVNNNNSNIIYLTVSLSNDVLKSTDGGVNFVSIKGNLPSEPKLIIKHKPNSNLNDLYLGTALGVYHINDSMTGWEVFSNNLPNVPVRDLEINTNDGVIIAGTFGRGVWKSTIEEPLEDDEIVSIDGPTTVSLGEEINVTVNYKASTNRKVKLELKVGDNSYFAYGQYRNVTAGTETETYTFTVPNNAPLGSNYKYVAFITTATGGWSNRLDYKTKSVTVVGSNTSDLLGHWPFNGNTNDVSGNNHHATAQNSPSYSTGQVGQGMNTNGSYAKLASDPFDLSKFTLMAWVKPSNVTGTWRVIMEKDRFKSDWYGIYQKGNKIHFRWSSNFTTGTMTTSAAVLQTNTFAHVAVTFSNGTAKIYINGELKGTKQGVLGAVSSSDGELRFGLNGSGNEKFQGVLDEAKIFGTALTAVEIQGEIGDTTPPTNPSNLVATDTTETTTFLNWVASTDNVGVIGYDIFYAGDINIGTVPNSNSPIEGLVAGNTYIFKVRAIDDAGNTSEFSNTVTVTATGSSSGSGAENGATAGQENSIELYPNPTTEKITLKLPVTTNGWEYQLVTVSGQVIKKGLFENTTSTLDLKALTNGIYFLQLTSDQKTEVHRIVKK